MSGTIVTGKPLLVCRYEWKLTGIELNKTMTVASKMLKFSGDGSFRVGLKIRTSSYPTLLFITTNLNKLGMKVVDVVFSSQNFKCQSMSPMKSSCAEQDVETGGSIQLFQALLTKAAVTANFTLTFEIYVSGIQDNFQLQQIDCLFGEQLMSPIEENVFEFVLGELKIPVHKFILAARSPVFAAKFGSEGGTALQQEKMDDGTDLHALKQLLHFIYTGTLDAQVIHPQLGELAKMYQITTLEALCEAASHDIDGDQMMELFSQLDLKAGQSPLAIKPEADSQIVFQAKAMALDFTWRPKKSTDPYSLCTDQGNNWTTETFKSEPFEYQGRKLFRLQVEILRRWSGALYCYDLIWIFLGYPSKKTGLQIELVSHTTTINGIGKLALEKMQEKLTSDGKFLQLFTSKQMVDLGKSESLFPFTITCHVKAVSTVEKIGYRLVDSAWKDQLWASSVNKQLTDVELLVGGKTFSAHRSLLSVRSPVFSAMFNSGMKEAQTGQVCIQDADPNTFGYFLHFLYTGMLEPSADKKQLYPLADRYQVEALLNLCQPAVEPEDVDGMTKAFFSC